MSTKQLGAQRLILEGVAPTVSPPESLNNGQGREFEIHISGRLTLLRTPRGTCGEWTCAEFLITHPGWHRRLTADAFLWLRDAVHRVIESGSLSSEFADALQRLEWIRAVGIEYGAFTPDEVADHQHAPEWYSFSSGLPHWADEI